MKNMRKIIIISNGAILAAVAFIIYYYGYFSDQYPQVEIPEFIIYGCWIFLISSFILLIINILISTKNFIKYKKIIITLWLISIVLLIIVSIYSFLQVRNHPINREGNSTQYASNSLYEKIDLDGFKKYTESPNRMIIYVGRKDCEACIKFEKNLLPILSKNKTSIPTYYTNLDRDGRRSEEMYTLLSNFQISSVPAIIITENGNLLKKISSHEEFNEMENYYRNT